MDTVFIEGLSLKGKHGVHEHERQVEQEFIIDIRADIDTNNAVRSDKLEDTANYSDFMRIAEEVVRKNSFYLIERLGETIAKRVLDDARIVRVEVTVRKPAALQNGKPGVRIVRSRA